MLHSGPKGIKLKHKSTLDTFDTPMSFLCPKIVTAVKHHICADSFNGSSLLVTQGQFKNQHFSRASSFLKFVHDIDQNAPVSSICQHWSPVKRGCEESGDLGWPGGPDYWRQPHFEIPAEPLTVRTAKWMSSFITWKFCSSCWPFTVKTIWTLHACT